MISTREDIYRRLSAYVRKRDGESYIDLLPVMADVITILKVEQKTKADFLVGVADLWDDIQIEVVTGRLQ